MSKKKKKRGYKQSARTRQQRRDAARKHGEYAAEGGELAKLGHPCRRKDCPVEYPCEIKRMADAKEQPLEVCPASLVTNAGTFKKYLAALQGEGLEGLQELRARQFANLDSLFGGELLKLLEEGLVATAIARDAETGEVVSERPVNNPRAEMAFKLAKLLGVEAREHGLTPRSEAEKGVDEAIGSLVDQARALREKLG